MSRLWFHLRAMLRRLLGGDARDEELSEEIRAYVEHDTESKIRSGMTPEDARRAALIELGGAEQVKERVREGGAGAWWESIFRDIRYALRSLGQARAFSSTVIGSLSLGLAAMILAFAMINGLMQRPLPGVQDQDRLVEVGILNFSGFGWGLRRTVWTDYPEVVRALEGMPSLEGLASFTESRVAATLPEPRSLQAAFVSPNYFDVFGVRPEIGRTFAPEEGRIESASVAVISRALWMREFGGAPSVIGQPVRAGDQTFVIIGVAPQGFAGTTRNVDLWLPIVFTDLLAMNDPSGSSGAGGFSSVNVNDSNPRARFDTWVGCATVSASAVSRRISASLQPGLSGLQTTRRPRSGPRFWVSRDSTVGARLPALRSFLVWFSLSPVSTPRTFSWCAPHGAAGSWPSGWRSAHPASAWSGSWSSRA